MHLLYPDVSRCQLQKSSKPLSLYYIYFGISDLVSPKLFQQVHLLYPGGVSCCQLLKSTINSIYLFISILIIPQLIELYVHYSVHSCYAWRSTRAPFFPPSKQARLSALSLLIAFRVSPEGDPQSSHTEGKSSEWETDRPTFFTISPPL